MALWVFSHVNCVVMTSASLRLQVDICHVDMYSPQTHPVVGAYMEFVERKPLPEHQHLAQKGQLQEIHRRDGFEADSAKNIFASTTLAATQVQKGPA